MGCLTVNIECINSEVSVDVIRHGNLNVEYSVSKIPSCTDRLNVVIGLICEVDVWPLDGWYLAVDEGRVVTSDNEYIVVTE